MHQAHSIGDAVSNCETETAHPRSDPRAVEGNLKVHGLIMSWSGIIIASRRNRRLPIGRRCSCLFARGNCVVGFLQIVAIATNCLLRLFFLPAQKKRAREELSLRAATNANRRSDETVVEGMRPSNCLRAGSSNRVDGRTRCARRLPPARRRHTSGSDDQPAPQPERAV